MGTISYQSKLLMCLLGEKIDGETNLGEQDPVKRALRIGFCLKWRLFFFTLALHEFPFCVGGFSTWRPLIFTWPSVFFTWRHVIFMLALLHLMHGATRFSYWRHYINQIYLHIRYSIASNMEFVAIALKDLES